MAPPLADIRVLLVEDDPIIGLDLVATLEAAGASVIGPAHDKAGALALLEGSSVDVAVLDHLIIGGDSLPIADRLVQRGVVFLFHTSHRGTLQHMYRNVPIIDKPSRPGELVAAIKTLIATRG